MIAWLWGQISSVWASFSTWLQNMNKLGFWTFAKSFFVFIGLCITAFLNSIFDLLSFLFDLLNGIVSLFGTLVHGAPTSTIDPTVLTGIEAMAFVNHFVPLTEWLGVEFFIIGVYASAVVVYASRWLWKTLYP